MKSRSIQVLTIVSVVAGAARIATAAEPSSPWSLSISGGDSFGESGSLRTPLSTHFTDLGALDPTLSGTAGTFNLDTLKYEDLFPFAGLTFGATHLDAIRATITSPDLSTELQNLHFSSAGMVFSQSLGTGVDYTPNDAFGLRFSIDADHFARPPGSDDPRLTGFGLGSSDGAHDFWTFPVSVAASYRF